MQWVLGSKIALSMQRIYGLKGVAMETCTLDPRCWQIGRILAQSADSAHRPHRSIGQVVRTRYVAVAIPVAGVAGAVVYGARCGAWR